MKPLGISDESISVFAEFINSTIGLYFPPKRWDSLRRGLCAASHDFAREFGREQDPESCMRWLMSSPLTKEHQNILADNLTIGETYFFRDNDLFRILGDVIIPELIREHASDRKLRFWSAGCCSGEEPYSLAILMDYMIRDRREWDIEIFATDINVKSLAKAKRGLYTNWSFRETPQWIMDNYFRKADKNTYEISSGIREMIVFEQLNLAKEPHFSLGAGMDVVLCRNVLMYFDPNLREIAIDRLKDSLSLGGWLAVSSSETNFLRQAGLKMIRFPEIFLHRKDGSAGALDQNRSEKWNCEETGEWRRIFSAPPEPSGTRRSGYGPFLKARSLYNKGRYDESAKMIAKILDLGLPEDMSGAAKSEIMILLAKSLMKIGMPDDAARWCEAAVEYGPPEPDYCYLLSTIYRELGCFGESGERLREILETDPEYVLAHFSLGHLAKLEGRRGESEKHLLRALDLLKSTDAETVLPHGDGVTAGTLSKIVKKMIET